MSQIIPIHKALNVSHVVLKKIKTHLLVFLNSYVPKNYMKTQCCS